MVSTHMGYGFVFAYVLSLLFGSVLFGGSSFDIVSLNVYFVLLGLLGGILPDVDRWEQVGFSHRKTLHYATGYGMLAIVLIASGYFLVWIMGASCFFAGAWLHSFMDIFDGFWNDPSKGVYEHFFIRRWIRALDWIPFASLREWSLQSFPAVLVIAVSPQLSAVVTISGWIIALASFLVVWLCSTLFEFRRTVPQRWEMEDRTFIKLGLQSKHRRVFRPTS